jgi:hypothetical protein
MTARRRGGSGGGSGAGDVGTPAQQDEADVTAEFGAEEDASGELVASEDKVRELGAVNSEAVIENRRIEEMVDKKRGGVKDVQLNIDDPLLQYDSLIKVWPASTLNVYVRRLTGSPKQDTVTTHPRTGAELYEAIKSIHGEHEEADYALKYWDTHGRKIRCNGRISMPDTRPPKPVPGATMQPPYQYAPPGYPAVPAPAAQAAQGAAPGGAVDPMQMFSMFMKMQADLRAQQTQPQPQAAAAPQQTAPQAPQMPPMPAQNDPAAMMKWMQDCFQMFQQMQASVQAQAPQPAQQPAGAPASAMPTDPMMWFQQPPAPARGGPHAQAQQPQQPAMNPMLAMMGMPPVQPPPGMMWVPGFGFVSVDALTSAMMGGRPGPGGQGGGPAAAGPYRGPYRSGYDPGHAPPQGYPGGSYPQQQQQQQPPKTAAEQFRESIGVLKTAAEMVSEVQSLFPGQEAPAAAPEREQEEPSPVRIMEVGDYKLALDRQRGNTRGWETLWVNMPNLLKWAGEQREAIQKAQAERKQERPQLPPGYVEVTPDYVPPPGYVPVPVDQIPPQFQQQPPAQHSLPQPPEQMPPPITTQQQTQPDPRRTWGPPTYPDSGGQR